MSKQRDYPNKPPSKPDDSRRSTVAPADEKSAKTSKDMDRSQAKGREDTAPEKKQGHKT